jgi:hypothetical protein
MQTVTLTVNQWQNILRIGGGMIPAADRRRICDQIDGQWNRGRTFAVPVQPETVAIIEGR